MSTTKMTVVRPGILTTVQDWPGRIGYWKVGVPPSGPMDDLSFRLGNVALGNPEGAAGLESAMSGPALTFDADTYVCVTGADVPVTIDGHSAEQWRPLLVPAGATLDVGTSNGAGLRVYVTIQGSMEIDDYLGSAATFTLGKFGGLRGGTLTEGDIIEIVGAADPSNLRSIPMEHRPVLTSKWEIAVTEGPHGAPDFFTRADMETLFATDYEVHFNSDRTGVRLIGPKPEWARQDGGEAGLHPSNIHDNAYSVGALDFTGDTPILLGPDGPSLGGFVCPVTVVAAERWKLGQLKAGDTIRFVPIRAANAAALGALGVERRASFPVVFSSGGDGDDGVIARREAETAVTYRRSGDDNVLVEYGDMTLDLALRARAHALHERIEAIAPTGLLDLTPGIRSLQVKVDPDVLPISTLMGLLAEVEDDLPAASELVVPSRTVRMPLSWDDPSTREAIQRYMHGVRADAPWCPWNIEFIRRMNGLDTVADVFDTVFAADYMVLGLGDVYLGAPVATPLDPQIQPGTHLDAGERRRDRRRIPVHLRHGRPRRISVRGPHHAGVEPSLPRAKRFVRGRKSLAVAVLRPHLLVPGGTGGTDGPARRYRSRPRWGCGDHRRRVLPRRARQLPRRQSRLDRRVPRDAGNSVRRRTHSMVRGRRIHHEGRYRWSSMI